MASGEIIKRADSALQSSVQMTRYRALETMDAENYNPVNELIAITKDLKKKRLETMEAEDYMPDPELEIKIHMKLLEYYSLAPKKQMQLDVQQQAQMVVLPVSYAGAYEGRDLSPCKPQLIDVIPQRNAIQEFMNEPTDPGS